MPIHSQLALLVVTYTTSRLFPQSFLFIYHFYGATAKHGGNNGQHITALIKQQFRESGQSVRGL